MWIKDYFLFVVTDSVLSVLKVSWYRPVWRADLKNSQEITQNESPYEDFFRGDSKSDYIRPCFMKWKKTRNIQRYFMKRTAWGKLGGRRKRKGGSGEGSDRSIWLNRTMFCRQGRTIVGKNKHKSTPLFSSGNRYAREPSEKACLHRLRPFRAVRTQNFQAIHRSGTQIHVCMDVSLLSFITVLLFKI